MDQDKAFYTVLGMSISYVVSFIGLGLAWWSWRKHHARKDGER